MNGKTFFKALSIKAKQYFGFSRHFARSYVSLFLVLILGVTSTLAWFTEHQSAHINSGNIEFQSASSLRINKDKSSGNKISIPAFTLDEASSYDGRNIYFPVGESFKTKTADMFFREGNKGDENVHYVYKDFELKGTSGNTFVYVKSYEIKIEDADGVDNPQYPEVNAVYHDQLEVKHEDNDTAKKPIDQTFPCDNCPIRLAFIADSSKRPVVIDPSAQVADYVDNTQTDNPATGGAVYLVNDNGVPERRSTYPAANWNAFSSYYYGKTPLFMIPGGETLNVTLVIWLEGSLPDCDKYIGKKISVDIDIESNFAEMDTITFYDDSQPDDNVSDAGSSHWVSNGDPIIACSYEDPFSEESPKRWKTVIMTKTADYTWQAKIPKKAVTNISFYRLTRENGENQGTIYNAWHTTSNISTWIEASNIPDNWYVSGSQDLDTTRQYTDPATSTVKNALVYTAVHGNGYSSTPVTARRLAPCVGYWNYSGGSGGGGSSGGGESGGGESGGGSSTGTKNIGISVDVKGWVSSNYNSDSATRLHFTTSSGGNYSFDRGSLSGNHFEQHFNLDSGEEITGFYLQYSRSTYNFTLDNSFTVSRDVNIVYTMQENDYLRCNLST